MPRLAHGAVEHAVGRVVPHEPLGGRVPLQPAPAEADADEPNVGNRDRAVSGFGRGHRRPAAQNAVDEVVLMMLRPVELHVLVGDRLGGDRFGLGAEPAPGHPNLAFAADEPRRDLAHLGHGGQRHLNAVGPGVANVERGWRIVDALGRGPAGALDLDRAGVVGAVAPLGDVDVVDAPIPADAAQAVVGDVVPDRVALLLGPRPAPLIGVRGPWRGPQPEVVVQVFRDRLSRLVGEGKVVRHAHQDRVQAADAAVADQFTAKPEIPAGTLLRSPLEDRTVPTAGLAEGLVRR